MANRTHRRAEGVPNRIDTAEEIQLALNGWLADLARTVRRRTPTESKAFLAEMRELHATAAAKAPRQGTEGPLDSASSLARRAPSTRGRGKSQRSLTLVEAARTILEEIQPASVRAVSYRLFTMGLIPSMAKTSTSRVSKQITWAREQGLISWGWIVDETREAERVSAWADPAAFIETVQRSYRRDRWIDQPDWIEIWSEKGTIRGTLAPVLHEYGVTFRVMHGFASSTAVHQIAEETQRATKRLTVFYVGDWDPSGMHMSAVDLPSRLTRYDGEARLVRLALDERDLASLPSFSVETKRGDPRYRWFRARHGGTCWELDALSPVVLRDRVEQAILDRLDLAAWGRAAITERAECESLDTILQTWPGISSQGSKYSPPTSGRG